ncbi:gluconate 2-dehydrogenase subunit 3 family protein [Streptomyces sp. NBC_00654]|uniref:gluconate 2-dehydrogenase subunit 3 family protein n=1 Tax=Streptomyces sp. NBC_00654 TaxID=2975799 RepID=UPI00225B3AE3|nr:gluconate 2-dehydrogenase subunit 3 family protein [Streptomyces sp. NBC_00654]MCX4967443.1 gluconate 2-dehydrogenase subunit 3 family protein [Streptomyces sp. NBC_00654]
MWILRPPDTSGFDTDQRQTVEVLFDAILPGGARRPGAADADAAEYVDRLLAMGPGTHPEIPAWRLAYPVLLAALDTAARQAHAGRGVTALDRAEATVLLRDLAAGTLPDWPADALAQPAAFALLRAHCIEGCFGDPRWGGNHEAVIWRWYGYLTPAEPFTRPTVLTAGRPGEGS